MDILFDIVYISLLFGIACVSLFFAQGIIYFRTMTLKAYDMGDINSLHPDDQPIIAEAIKVAKIRDKLWIALAVVLFFIGIASLFGILALFYY